MCLFGDLSLQGRFLAPGDSRVSSCVQGGLRRSWAAYSPQERCLELWKKPGLRLWGWRHFPVKSGVFLCFFGREGLAEDSDKEEAWDAFLLEAFSCPVWSFSVLLWRLQEVSSCVSGGLWRSGKAQSSRTVA